jgi:hypothetical protein
MNTSLPSRPRPYWHVDAKWVVGLLLLGVLSLTLLVYNLVQVTDEEPAVDALSLALALVLSPEGIDDPQSVELILEQIRSSPDKVGQEPARGPPGRDAQGGGAALPGWRSRPGEPG